MKVLFLLLLISTSLYADIDGAYKREFIFLNTQLKELTKQKDKVQKQYNQAKIKAEKSLKNSQQRLVLLNAQNEKIAKQVYEIEQSLEIGSENYNTLDNVTEQLKSDFGIDKDVKTDYIQLFNLAINNLNKQTSIHAQKSQIYLESGEAVRADLLHLGELASYAHINNKYYLLVPAGGGQLKVWKELAEIKNIFTANVKKNDTLTSFIYSSKDKEVKQKVEKSIVDFVGAGGTIAWIIVVMGCLGLLLCLIRFLNLFFYTKEANEIDSLIIPRDISQTLENITPLVKEHGSATLVKKILDNKEKNLNLIEDIVEEGVIHEHKFIDKHGALILVLAAVAPLMGLLGTVTGMISTFDIITEFGTGDPKLLSSGISEALITTELGLIVAIPTLLLGNVLNSKGKTIKMNMDKTLLKVINGLH